MVSCDDLWMGLSINEGYHRRTWIWRDIYFFGRVSKIGHAYMTLKWSKNDLDDLMIFPIGSMYAIYGNIYHQYTWVNYNDLTATSLESWLKREIIPKWP